MNNCIIPPPEDRPPIGFDKFWAWYFYDGEKCPSVGNFTYEPPDWINQLFPLGNRRHETSVEANYSYQITYLSLHSAWFITCLILFYGNARKQWVLYLPWILITLTLIIMDLAVSVFFIEDVIDEIKGGGYSTTMVWILSMYFRLFFLWVTNIEELATAFNSFCKSYHKRSKQTRLKRKQDRKQAMAVSQAAAAADAAARAEVRQEQQHMQMVQQEQWQQNSQPGVDNRAFAGVQAAPVILQPPLLPRRPPAPKEQRPFTYLNSNFQPDNPHDLEGMRANPASVPEPVVNALRNSKMIRNDPVFPAAPVQNFYIPDDGYAHKRDRSPEVPSKPFHRRHDSLQNFRTQEPEPGFVRSSSIRDPSRMPQYNDSPHYDKHPGYQKPWDEKSRPSNMSNLKKFPRVNLIEGKEEARLQPQGQRRRLSPPSSHQRGDEEPYPLPASQKRNHSLPMDRERPYSSQGNREMPYSRQGKREKPYSPQGNREKPYSPQGNREKPYSPQGNREKPYSPQGNREKPYSPQGNREKPYSPQGNREKPYSPQGNRERPYSADAKPFTYYV
ncbi:uncharacterized protein LOC121864150 isoform X2 [Homarus americanus]|nr:uncharacterized protein LOC121864150 isoform X2 [Homarus americanus]